MTLPAIIPELLMSLLTIAISIVIWQFKVAQVNQAKRDQERDTAYSTHVASMTTALQKLEVTVTLMMQQQKGDEDKHQNVIAEIIELKKSDSALLEKITDVVMRIVKLEERDKIKTSRRAGSQ